LGDVLIALPFTRRQAAEMGRDLADELILLAVHGTLHLLGYDHAEPGEEIRMWARQDEILIGLK
jgi:probable rRNA maturation factor